MCKHTKAEKSGKPSCATNATIEGLDYNSKGILDLYLILGPSYQKCSMMEILGYANTVADLSLAGILSIDGEGDVKFTERGLIEARHIAYKYGLFLGCCAIARGSFDPELIPSALRTGYADAADVDTVHTLSPYTSTMRTAGGGSRFDITTDQSAEAA